MKKLNQSQLRAAFWDAHPQFEGDYRRGKRQNDYKADIRCAFVDFVDAMHRDGQITDFTAQNSTL